MEPTKPSHVQATTSRSSSSSEVVLNELPIEPAYGEALARIHDDGFGFIATGAAKLVLAGLKLNGFTDGVVAELACGGGISSLAISEAGYSVRGYDISESMIELARRRVPQGEFEVCSLYDAALPERCVAVTAIGEAFNYRFDPRAGFDSVRAVFDQVHGALVEGGIFVFDVAQPNRAMPRMEHTFWEGAGWQVTSEVVEDPDSATLERRITSRTGSALDRVDVELHRLWLYEHEAVFAALQEAGFDPATLASYGEDYRFSAGHGGFYAVKI
jgi:SAM-dependent methyltransferase